MADVRDHSSDELTRELERRQRISTWKDENQDRVDAVITTLQAAIGCLENLPDETIAQNQLDKAARLAYELSWMCLPGGSVFDTPVGMDAGWLAIKPSGLVIGKKYESQSEFRSWQDSVLQVVEPRHDRKGFDTSKHVPVHRLTMEEDLNRF